MKLNTFLMSRFQVRILTRAFMITAKQARTAAMAVGPADISGIMSQIEKAIMSAIRDGDFAAHVCTEPLKTTSIRDRVINELEKSGYKCSYNSGDQRESCNILSIMW